MGDNDNPAGLTERELEVLQHRAHGWPQRYIAHRLYLGVETVKTHLDNGRAKIRGWASWRDIDLGGDPLFAYYWKFVEKAEAPPSEGSRKSPRISGWAAGGGGDKLARIRQRAIQMSRSAVSPGKAESYKPVHAHEQASDETLIALLERSDDVARTALAILFGRYALELTRLAAGYRNPEELIAITFMGIVQDCRQFNPFEDDAPAWINGKLDDVLRQYGESAEAVTDQRSAAIPEEVVLDVLKEAHAELSEADRNAVAVPGAGSADAIRNYCAVVGKVFLEMVGEHPWEGTGE